MQDRNSKESIDQDKLHLKLLNYHLRTKDDQAINGVIIMVENWLKELEELNP